MTNLIILRGPSASGKSTIANILKHKITGKNAILDFDVYRMDMLDKQDGYYEVAADMIVSDALIALNAGFNVIIDGFYRVENFPNKLEKLINEHQINNYAFLFNTSIEETIKRHARRNKSKSFGEKELREWYYTPKTWDKVGFEYVIPEQLNINETVKYIIDKIIK